MVKNLFIIPVLLGALAFQTSAQGCASPKSEEGVNIFGYLQTQYDYNMYDKTESNFGFNRSRIGVMGNIPYDFSYYVLLETSPFKKDGPKAYLLDAFITYNRFSFLKASMGSFKMPFGLELNTPCNALHTINRSKVVNELTAPDRDMGLMLLGGSDTTMFKYALAVTNGDGLLLKDKDKYKDIIGRLEFKPVSWIKAGGSVKFGKSANENPTLANNTRKRFGGDVELKYGNFLVQGEYIYGEDDGSYVVGGGCGGDPVTITGNNKRSGMFVMALYSTPWNIQPVVKYENYNSDRSKTNNLEQITTVGFNYFFNDWTRLQINYEYAAEKPKEIKNDRLMVQLQVKF
jgi:hypothetical protein